ncbi:MAG: response regulator [Anaerolineae bacterium]|nr:response regulator [Anaerolineae bacterium]
MNKRIVYVEDDAQSARLVRMILNANGYDVEVADSTEDGMRLIELHQPVLILMDINLPDIDGRQATIHLKHSAYKHIPVVAVTALAMRGDRELILAAGCDDYLPKPFNVQDLLDTVQRHLTETAEI